MKWGVHALAPPWKKKSKNNINVTHPVAKTTASALSMLPPICELRTFCVKWVIWASFLSLIFLSIVN